MILLNNFPNCCSAGILIDLYGSVEQIKKEVNGIVTSVKRGEYHTVLVAIVIREQSEAIEALTELGWQRSPNFMRKTGYSKGYSQEKYVYDEGMDERDTVLFYLPMGDVVED